jgi:hypothetical protein
MLLQELTDRTTFSDVLDERNIHHLYRDILLLDGIVGNSEHTPFARSIFASYRIVIGKKILRAFLVLFENVINMLLR